MFGRAKAKLSLIFNRKAIITHRFDKDVEVCVGRRYYIQGVSRIWAEATPINKDSYVVTQKELTTHNNIEYDRRSILDKSRIGVPFNGQHKTIFTRNEAIVVLKALEKGYEEDGYFASPKQSFAKRIYTNKQTVTPKSA